MHTLIAYARAHSLGHVDFYARANTAPSTDRPFPSLGVICDPPTGCDSRGMKPWLAGIAVAIILGICLACAPSEQQVRFQQQHEADWIPPTAVPFALRDLPTQALLRGMGDPVSSHDTMQGDTNFVHYEFCRELRTFHDGDEQRQYKWWDNSWHPVRWTSCEGTQRIRVMTANGRVAAVD